MTKLEIIDETVEYYRDHPRALVGKYKCTYKREDGAKCAVGRCIDPEKFEEFHEYIYKITKNRIGFSPGFTRESALWEVSVHEIPNLDTFLQEKYRGHSKMFWQELQSLHDTSLNWRDDGKLTDRGKIIVERFKKRYNEV